MTHEYEMALLTAENHGPAHGFLREGRLAEAVASLGRTISFQHYDISPMDRQRIILEVLSRWQSNFDS